MDGYIIKLKPNLERKADMVKMCHLLYGRFDKKITRTKHLGYYAPGMLHNIRYFKTGRSEVFVTTIDGINQEELRIYGEVEITPTTLDVQESKLETGLEHWERHARRKYLMFRELKRKHVKSITLP